jgi:hypothetical protein
MLKSGSILRTSADFDNAMMFQLNVIVWQDGEIIDYGGNIESFTDASIRINDCHYFRTSCEFKVR